MGIKTCNFLYIIYSNMDFVVMEVFMEMMPCKVKEEYLICQNKRA